MANLNKDFKKCRLKRYNSILRFLDDQSKLGKGLNVNIIFSYFKLIKKFIKYLKNKQKIAAKKIQAEKNIFYKIRTPKDSKLNINKSIKSEFNLFRVLDNKNYPILFQIYGKKFAIKISKL